ncbi:sigma-54-dependent transcriptional regulator [Geosporobacter ferrireducens]|uniref:Stage 0 sporulation protein A homolog n=1 Tax=Geosporobacter ferrireducens TaxID=1424294 RepID=A0A1D8GE56_9FIRM|nr:sigma-54 dependent transcriptional regulator [Geosporobacter ferrireducens]AOT69182.1 two-component system response regulator [Geosporobacter ferrireducens]MTI56859.1 sigma-54-dependent Fis family transcriptional regulator [Geosporobacter ferrireducens]
MKKILIADDEKNMRWVLAKNLKEVGLAVIEAKDGEEAFHQFLDTEPDMVIVDYRMPKIDGMEVLRRIGTINEKTPVIMITAHGNMEAAVEAMKLGAIDYVSKPFDIEELMIKVKKALNLNELNQEITYLRNTIAETFDKKIIGSTKRMYQIFELVEKIADTNATVLITGESGTGKELIASAIHNKSSRKNKPYIRVNCGAIPENLLESELFGYEKGAFTGAMNRKQGRFDRAQGGTIFLDEIGELSMALQVKLLRVLQEREFERVGGTELIKADVRIVAATNRNLEKMVEEGSFREDLLYRLKVIPIQIPPLRERKEDIPVLIDFFIDKYAKEMNKGDVQLNRDVMEILMNYDFPGNIRELENIIERMVILSSGGCITTALLSVEVVKGAYLNKQDIFILPEEGIILEELEKSLVRQALERVGGNQTQAARLLGISRHALIYRIEKFNLSNGESS